MANRPPLPLATVIDGRSLYTAGDMRAYYDLAILSTTDEFPDEQPEQINETLNEASSKSVDDLMNMFGMKK